MMTQEEKAEIADLFISKGLHAVQYFYTLNKLFLPENIPLLNEVSEQFFSFVNQSFQQYILLEIAKLTDPKVQNGKLNLSARLVGEELFEEEKDDAMTYVVKMESFRELIKDARNKIISHNDLDTYKRNVPISKFGESDLRGFFEALKGLLDMISRKYKGDILGEIVLSQFGDEQDLINNLRRAKAFQLAFESADLETKSYLFNLKRSV